MSEPEGADPITWTPIPARQRRVLGVLIEKQKTSKTADAYPMTLNAIAAGCNQKSNRDPLYELDADDWEETLGELQNRAMVVKMEGSRADRWRHLLYELWRASKVEMAVLAELLLRGPQGLGDLRARVGRMEPVETLDELRAHLASLKARSLVVESGPLDRRGALVSHGFHTPEELAAAFAGAGDAPEPAGARGGALEARLAAVEAELAGVRSRLAALEKGNEKTHG